MAEIVNLSARRPRPGAAVELIVERAVCEILMSIHGTAGASAALRGLACSLTDRKISAVDFGQAMQMVINRMLEIEREQPDPAA